MKPADIFFNEKDKEIVVDAPFIMRDVCAGLSSRRWDKDTKTWRVPATLPALEELISKFNGQAQVHGNIWDMLGSKRSSAASFQDMKERLDLRPDDADYEWYTKPKSHQVSGTSAILRRDRVLLLDEMGLGKTKQMIDAAMHRMKHGLIKRAVIIVPASLKYNWVKEIEKHAFPAYRSATVIEGVRRDREEQFAAATKTRFLIINYELARIHEDELNVLTEDQMLVCDEAHKMKNLKSKTSKVIHSLNPKYAVLATGTPIANKPEDIFSLTHFVEKGLLGFTYWQFEQRYCNKGGFGGKQVLGYRNLTDFRERVGTVSIRRLKDNVLDLPPKVYETRHALMDGDQKREYQRMRDEMVAFYREMPEKDFRLKVADARTQILRLQQIADGFIAAGGRDAMWFSPNSKLDILDEIVEDVCGNGQKLVVWSRFLPVTAMIAERYPEHGPVRIYGDVPKRERFDLVQKFQEDPATRIMVAQVHTGGVGFDMTASQVQVFYDLWWSPSVNEQAEDRLHRIGTRGTVSVIRLACRDSVDQHLMNMLDNKKQWSDLITGDDLRLTRRAMLTLLGEDVPDGTDQRGSRRGNDDAKGDSVPTVNPGRSSGKVAPVRSGARKVRSTKKASRPSRA